MELPYAKHDDGLVVKAILGALKLRYVGKDCRGDVLRWKIAAAAEQRGEALFAIHFAFLIFSIEYSVGDEDDGVAWLRSNIKFLVCGVRKHAQRKAFSFDGDGLAAPAEDRLHST